MQSSRTLRWIEQIGILPALPLLLPSLPPSLALIASSFIFPENIVLGIIHVAGEINAIDFNY